MNAAGTISGWKLYEHDGHYFVRYEQVAGYVSRHEPSVAKALLDHVLRNEESAEGEAS